MVADTGELPSLATRRRPGEDSTDDRPCSERARGGALVRRATLRARSFQVTPRSCEAPRMTYDEFKKAWVSALRESGLSIMSLEPIEETLDLRTTDRTCKAFVEPFGGQHAEPFHVTAALEFRWDALQTARTNTTEEDMLNELLGLERTRRPRTELPWLRADVMLRASIVWGKEIPLPTASAWQRWAREMLGRLERIEPVIPIENVREGRNNLPEILAWQSEPELNVLCSPDGMLKLRGVEIATWQAINLPRKWGDTSRKPDKRPHEQLAAMFERLKVALNAWMEALDHLTPSN